jgi:hypothetical protein
MYMYMFFFSISIFVETGDVDTCTKADFPYGLRLSWALPSSRGEEGIQPMTFVIHLKDNRKVRLQLRLSSLGWFWLSFVRPFGFIAPKTLNYLVFQSFDYKRIWWRLFQKCVVGTKFDIYVFISTCRLKMSLYLTPLFPRTISLSMKVIP